MGSRPNGQPKHVTLSETYPGLRVLDISTNLAGPFAAMILGDMGADVIKVERTPTGDDTRSLPPRWGEESTVFLSVNRNKRSIALDIRSPEGRAAFLEFVESADVVVESFPPGGAAKLRLTEADLRARNRRVVVASVSAFGDGPLGSQAPGYDALVQAVSGLMSFTGHPGSDPVRIAPSVLDLTTGMWTAMGIMAALARRNGAGGEECDLHVRTALVDSAFTLMCHQLLGYLATGDLPQRLGSAAPSATPYRVFAAKDRSFMLATASDPQFDRLCKAVGKGELATDGRFRTVADRLAHRNELDTILGAVFATEPVSVWLDRLGGVGLSVGQVNNLEEALEEPLVSERSLLVAPNSLDWKDGMPLLRLPIDSDGTGIRRPPPALGQHTAEILAEVGLTGDATRDSAAPKAPADGT